MLAHCNKNRDADNKAVFGGTSDVVDDCDCVFMLDEVSKTSTTKQVLFENIKSRGDVANELLLNYSIEEGKSYQHRLDSIEVETKDATERAKRNASIAAERAKDQPVMDAIMEAIDQGSHLKTVLINTAHENSGLSKTKLNTVLVKYIKRAALDGGIWYEDVGLKNAKSYFLSPPKKSTAGDYSKYKNGE